MYSVNPFESESIAQKAITKWIGQLKKTFQPNTSSKAIPWKPLLKPWTLPVRKKKELSQIVHDPYSFIVTVVVPNWPSRFQDKGFKKSLEKTIANECPAHLYPNILWLGKSKFQEFQSIYQMWWNAYSENEPSAWCFREDVMQFIMKHSFSKKKK